VVQDTVADALFGLTGVRVVEVDTEPDDSVTVYVQTAVTVACPGCASPAAQVKERVTGRLRDVPYGGRRVRVVWWKRRWSCLNEACPRGSFTESVADLPARSRVTPRLRQLCARSVTDSGRTVAEVAASHGVSWHTAHDAFTDAVTSVMDAPPEPVTDLGIDEVRRGRPRFTTDQADGVVRQVADRWHTGFTDLSGAQGLLGQVEGVDRR
jgi:transposase